MYKQVTEIDWNRRLFVSWFGFSRSDSLSYYLKANSFHIGQYKKHRKIFAPFKYIISSIKTLIALFKYRPNVTFVQNPPVFAVFTVWLYSIFSKTHFVVDTHSSAFMYKRWALLLPLYKFTARRASLNILHNEPLAQRVENWGAPSVTLPDPPANMTTDETYPFRNGLNVVFVCSYSEDEPVGEVIEAAKNLPQVNFYITGNKKYAPKDIIKNSPKNIVFTDFLPRPTYVALLKGCDIVIALTTDDFTMQCAAYEAMDLGRPIITSDWPVLANYFSKGTVHINNTASSLIKAIKKIESQYSFYSSEIQSLRKEKRTYWNESFSNILYLLSSKIQK